MAYDTDAAGGSPAVTEHADILAAANDMPDDGFTFDDDDGQQREVPDYEGLEPEPEASPQQAQEPGDDEEGGEEPEEGAEPAPEPEAEPDEDAQARAAAAEDAKTVKIDGQDIPLAEVKAGFMRRADYSKKTAEVAQQRKQVETYAQNLQQSEKQLAGVLELAMQIAQRSLPQRPDPALIDTDIVTYTRQERAYEAAMAEVNKLAQAQGLVGQRTQAQEAERQRSAQEEFQRALAAEAEAVRTKIPEMADPAKRGNFVRDAVSLGEKHWGLKEADILGIQDHRALLVLKDAMAYRKMQAAKPAALARAQAAPPIPAAARPSQGTRNGIASQAMKRLRSEGSIEAAAATLPDSWFT